MSLGVKIRPFPLTVNVGLTTAQRNGAACERDLGISGQSWNDLWKNYTKPKVQTGRPISSSSKADVDIL